MNRRLALLVWVILSIHFSPFAYGGRKVDFKVYLPNHFSEIHEIFLSGNHQALGNWEPKSIKLQRTVDGFKGSVPDNLSGTLEFKANLGNWNLAEVSASGSEIANRTANCSGNCSVEFSILNFRLPQFHPIPQTASKGLRYHFSFYFPELGNYRNIAVYLPPGYAMEPSRRYPVLYSVDGNNLFDRATMVKGRDEWMLDETLDSMISKGEIEPLIVVGIYNTENRADEYLFCRDEEAGEGGYADRYLQFLLSDIKPFIDVRYRTISDRKKTFLMGSSFGGHFALYAMKNYAHVFSKFISMSTAYWFKEYCLFKSLAQPQGIKPDRLWMDMGDHEDKNEGCSQFKNAVTDLNHAYDLVLRSGIPSHAVRKVIEFGGEHNETFWGRRFREAIHFVLQDSQD